MGENGDALDQLIGREVVIDASSMYVYVGRLTGRDHRYAVLEDADAHDLRDTSTTRDAYVIEIVRHGINQNRRRVLVRLEEVVSISSLDDVIL